MGDVGERKDVPGLVHNLGAAIPVLSAAEPAEPPPAPPFSREDLTGVFRRPDRVIAVALGETERVGRSLCEGRNLWLLMLLLLLAGVVGTVPYGLLSPARSAWSIAALFLGSLLICFPCLHIFAQFCGVRFGLGQMLTLALVLAAVAGLFALGFAPIIWFIGYSIEVDGWSAVTPRGLSLLLLGVSLFMGIIQMTRCLDVCRRSGRGGGTLVLLVTLWLPLFIFITVRMAMLLGLA